MPWHMMQWGNNHSARLYAEEGDRFFLDRLIELSQEFGGAVHAYALMTNHGHLLRTPERADSALLTMKPWGQRYVHDSNRTDKRRGALWEGRLRLCLTPSADDGLACDRSIALHPVRAGMARHPRDDRWTRYRAHGEGEADRLLPPHVESLLLGEDPQRRREASRALFNTHLGEAVVQQIREATNGM
jgi:putative transposase